MRFASCMAPNAEPFFVETAHFIGDRMGIETIIAHDDQWASRERLIDEGQIEVGWLCGLPYVWKADLPSPPVELLAAPVMRAARYKRQPVYYSDVLVRSDSHWRNFSELRGARWAYNEPGSHSGYNVVKSHLYDLDQKAGFFGSVHMAGSHEQALGLLLDGSIDAAAIDTTVFEIAVREKPDYARLLRSIETLGPSPMPPWVVSTGVDKGTRARIRQALTGMHQHPQGARILQRHNAARYAAVDDAFYDPIRTMDWKARQVLFGDETADP